MSTLSNRIASRTVVSRLQCRGCPSRPLKTQRKFVRLNARWKEGTIICCTSEIKTRKLISKSDIPVIFPRQDFTQQLFRWAQVDASGDGMTNFGAAFDVQPVYKDPDAPDEEAELWGFDAFILRDGERICQIGVYMDREFAEKHEFIGIGEDMFPITEGRVEQVEGKALEIWKVGDQTIDDDTRNVVRRFCHGLSLAITMYSSFGSCFSDDL